MAQSHLLTLPDAALKRALEAGGGTRTGLFDEKVIAEGTTDGDAAM